MLELAVQGKYASTIAQALSVSQQAVSVHLHLLVKAGLLEVDGASTSIQRHALASPRITIYRGTPNGIETLTRTMTDSSRRVLRHGPTDSVGGPRVEVHNYEVVVPVRHLGIKWLPSEAWLRSTLRRWDRDFHGVYLEVVGLSSQTMILRAAAEAPAGVRNGREIAEALCERKLRRVLALVENEYGCVLGDPVFRLEYRPGRAKIGVLDHGFERDLPQFVEGELAVVDRTPLPGTLHPKDPADADRVVLIARNIESNLQVSAESRALLLELVRQQSDFLRAMGELLARGGTASSQVPLVQRERAGDEWRDAA